MFERVLQIKSEQLRFSFASSELNYRLSTDIGWLVTELNLLVFDSARLIPMFFLLTRFTSNFDGELR
jgi:hypothetical protein